MFTKNFSYTHADIEQAFNLHYAKKYPIRSKLLLILGVLLLVLFLVFFVAKSMSSTLPQLKWLLLVMGLFYIGFYFFRKKSIVKRAMLNPTINQMESISINKEVLKLKGKNGEGDIAFSTITETEEDENSFLLYFTTSNFLIIPKRLLNAQELNELKSYLKK
ncbi:MAG: YcxB family protein [Chitinophagales bacterium]|nr:YcxB family protein [Chitinophagales bacterium]